MSTREAVKNCAVSTLDPSTVIDPPAGGPVRRLSLLFGVACCLAAVVLLAGTPAGAQADADEPEPTSSSDAGFVRVIEVSGLLDPVLAEFVNDAILDANQDDARILVLQLNSRGAVISDQRVNELARAITESAVPIAVWVGPSGSTAAGAPAELAGVADALAVAIGADLGDVGEPTLDPAEFGTVFGDNAPLLAETRVNWEQAVDLGIVPVHDPHRRRARERTDRGAGQGTVRRAPPLATS